MELKDYILMELAGLERSIKRVTDTLTQQEFQWRPSSGSNSIGIILFHVARLEDSFITTRIQGKPALWDTEKWFEKFNLSASEEGAHYTVDQVNAFTVPEKSALLAYYSAASSQTREYLKSLAPADLERKVNVFRGEVAIGNLFAFIVSHATGHIGEMSYLRGLQRGMDK